MKFIFAVSVASMVVLGACAPMAESDAGAPAMTAADQFVGKTLTTADGATFIFNADGTVGGSLRGEDIMGTYDADATEICSTYTAPDFLTGREFCSTPEVDGDTVIFNRRDGSQSPAYTISG